MKEWGNLNLEKQTSSRCRSARIPGRSAIEFNAAMTRCGVSHVTRLATPVQSPPFRGTFRSPFNFNGNRRAKFRDRSTRKSTGYCTFEVASRFVAADLSSQARARLERWESESRPASRQSPRRLSAWTMTRDDRCEAALHPSAFPGPDAASRSARQLFAPQPHRIAGRRCSFGCAFENDNAEAEAADDDSEYEVEEGEGGARS